MAAHAVPPGGFEDTDALNGQSPSASSDPLRRLEAELGETPGEHAEDEQLYAEAQGLVEEAWSLVTECLVLRDGLLDACHEIEQTMDGIQRRLTALPVALEVDGTGAAANVARSSANSGGHVANGVPSQAPGEGRVANGARSTTNGSAGPSIDGHLTI